MDTALPRWLNRLGSSSAENRRNRALEHGSIAAVCAVAYQYGMLVYAAQTTDITVFFENGRNSRNEYHYARSAHITFR